MLGTSAHSSDLMQWLKVQDWSIDGAHVAELPRLQAGGLILMDMDSTAIQIRCIDEIARLAGVGNRSLPLLRQRCTVNWISPKVCVTVWLC